MMDPTKVEAIVQFQPPENLKELQRFLGMIGWYRRFIKDFAKIAGPLYTLLKSTVTAEQWVIHQTGLGPYIALAV